MKFILFILTVSTISCTNNQLKRDVSSVNNLCEAADINRNILSFRDTKTGNRSNVIVLTIKSDKETKIENLSVNGVNFPFVFATGERNIFDDNENCPSISKVSFCRIHLAFEPTVPGDYSDELNLNFNVDDKSCQRKIKLHGTSIE